MSAVKTSLPRTSSTLRRVLGGKGNAFARHVVRRTAEQRAARPGATPTEVLAAIKHQHGARLLEAELEQLRLALEIDLPAAQADGGGA